MLLNTLKLVNFRKFRDEVIEFPRGMLGIIGKNGAGKSTILEAVGWVLYGSVMSRSAREEIKSQNADAGDICKVELEFSLTGHNYKIIRELKGKNALSQASVFIDGQEKPDVVKESTVNKYVESLLRMDYDTFMRSVYAKQKDLGSLSLLNKGERQKVIRRMLNVDKIDIAVTNIRADTRSKRDIIKGIKFTLEDIDELKQKQSQKKKEIKEINKIIEDLADKKTKLGKDKLSVYKLREKQDILYKEHNTIGTLISKKKSRLGELKNRFDDLTKEEKDLRK
ncbi:AAA family ATPase, partial [Candidatus Omnitrophota bacterium]